MTYTDFHWLQLISMLVWSSYIDSWKSMWQSILGYCFNPRCWVDLETSIDGFYIVLKSLTTASIIHLQLGAAGKFQCLYNIVLPYVEKSWKGKIGELCAIFANILLITKLFQLHRTFLLLKCFIWLNRRLIQHYITRLQSSSQQPRFR